MNPSTEAWMQRLLEAGAARLDAVGWHHAQALAQRARTHTGPVQALLDEKLQDTLRALEQGLSRPATRHPASEPPAPSPLALLLRDMTPSLPQASAQRFLSSMPPESPRARQFRQKLRQINVQKRVSKAMAQGPQNAGPINSHMLVLRSLGLMRDISSDYLNRFMAHVDTLMCLQASEQTRQSTAKGGVPRSKK